MTPAEPDEVIQPTAATPEHAAAVTTPVPITAEDADALTKPVAAAPEDAGEPPRGRRRWPWLALLLLILAAMLGTAVGVGIVLRGRSFGAQLPTDAAARPTFVIAAPPSPSPSGSPRSSATPAVTTSDEYPVEVGDTLRSIAQQVYGDPAQWPRIYDANRETIGPDPDTLSAGTRLRIPRP